MIWMEEREREREREREEWEVIGGWGVGGIFEYM